MKRVDVRHGLAALAALGGAIPGSAPLQARMTVPPESFVLGRDANGEPCAATRAWNDARIGSLFDRAWSITCRGVAASRPQGSVLAVRGVAIPAVDTTRCGAAVTVAMEGVGPVEARACIDATLGLPVTTIRFERGGVQYLGAASATALGPLEAALRTAAGVAPPPASRDVAVVASIPVAQVPAAPKAAASTATFSEIDPTAALQTGIALNQRGVYVEASRLLNDALSRLPASTPSLNRVELELEAGLADSNISQFDAASEHLERAGALLAQQPNIDRAAFLESKRATYRGLDLINRRDFKAAVDALGGGESAGQPLKDPAVLADLNQPSAGNGATASIATGDNAQLSRLLLEAQRQWARSVAYLATNDTARARAALERAVVNVTQLQRSVDPSAIIPIKARIQRQFGRVEARAGRIGPALTHFDCALATLQNVAPEDPRTCLLAPRAGARGGVGQQTPGGATGPLIAETGLERASLFARQPGADQTKVLADFDASVEALIASSAAGGIVPPAMETYLDLLADRDAAAPISAVEERFFRAIQAVGEPAIARQVAQLQRIVTADGPLGAKVRDRAELERQVVRIRYQLATATPEEARALEQERSAAEVQLASVNATLAADQRYRAVDDRPATIAEVQSALQPGEAYLKVTRLRSRTYGIVIDRERAYVYALAATVPEVDGIAAKVRTSIRNDSGSLPFFDVPAAFTLFKLIAGPAEPALLKADAIVVDPSGPLENLPAGVLVTDLASVRSYVATRATQPNDYSKVAFLGAQAQLSGALSARSFLISRALPESTAANPFIGFGQNAPAATLSAALTSRRISFGQGCDISYGELAQIMNANRPVSAAEISIAATALGVPNAPEITGRAFNDAALVTEGQRGEFDRYQVIHFATHGLPEMRVDCHRIPPSLVTSLDPPADAGDYPSDGLLTFSEIAGLRLNANLVVLSACDTASGVSQLGGRLSGQDESAATLDGLVRAFITANARAVLATYWNVPASAETDAFIRTFYATGRTATIGAALRSAQRITIAKPDYSHPYFWGAYFLVGDASKTMLSTGSQAKTRVAAK
ncbi:CHAT domain-containing protein [Microvirga sp. SRT01]|uniref:CHAT domain-containing protein n=1 Tax=Sphingomonas longa TaxID=2778730 RepID=A0ABS2D1I9_9SPHN|nr:CHAT domain-containing protein [Microvirga sp. SRT01]MBM6574779.1 CHAT domain-containing protein [Sphingomonas sp. BT552]MBR7707831.1 CHAT domain-containing protein [Microvirga sp. SRT01]